MPYTPTQIDRRIRSLLWFTATSIHFHDFCCCGNHRIRSIEFLFVSRAHTECMKHLRNKANKPKLGDGDWYCFWYKNETPISIYTHTNKRARWCTCLERLWKHHIYRFLSLAICMHFIWQRSSSLSSSKNELSFNSVAAIGSSHNWLPLLISTLVYFSNDREIISMSFFVKCIAIHDLLAGMQFVNFVAIWFQLNGFLIVL